jgi:hypothetical protein
MADDSAQRAGQLKPSVDQLAEQFATSCGASSRREIRDLADDLVLELIGTLGKASLGEIAQTLEALERRRELRPPPTKRPAAAPNTVTRRGTDGQERGSRTVETDAAAAGARDPFDITKPSELLEQVIVESPPVRSIREDEPPASGTRVKRPPHGAAAQRASAAHSVTATEESASGANNATGARIPPRPPAIALREGEQLLRSSGSGVVIRRMRTA